MFIPYLNSMSFNSGHSKFDKERKVYTQILKDKIEEYQAENRLPDDEMKQFYIRLRKKCARFWNTLAVEWENAHRGEL